ncbi:sodium:proton antiporter, partial [Candidatus Liberibacter asiaticus]
LQSLRSNAQQIIQNIPTVKNAVVTLTENKNPPQQRNNLNVKKFVAVA